MEAKKSPKKNFSRHISLYLLTGLNIALLLVLLAFNTKSGIGDSSKTIEERVEFVANDNSNYVVPEEVIPQKMEINEELPQPENIEEIDLVNEKQDEVVKEDPIIVINKPKGVLALPSNFRNTPKVAIPQLKEREKGVAKLKNRVPVAKVSQMAIYPGCEKYADDKKKSVECFNKQLNEDVGYELEDFIDIAKEENIVKAKTYLKFIIDTNGEMVEIEPSENGNEYLNPEAQKALERINQRLLKKGKKIKPAKLENGEEVELYFQLPILFTAE